MQTAILLIAHGSRIEGANDDLRELAQQLRATTDYAIVEPCYLELAEPDIDAGAVQCIQRGAGRIILLPFFLSAGLHVQRDLEAARHRLAGAHPGVEFWLAKPIGRHPKLLEILLDRVRETEANAPRAI